MAEDKISALLDEYEPRLRAEYLQAIRDLADDAILARVEEALARGDVAGAVALVMPPDADPIFAPMAYTTEDGYRKTGALTAETILPVTRADGSRRVYRFDAQQFLSLIHI